MPLDKILDQRSNFFVDSLVNRDGQNDQTIACVILMDLFQRGPLFEAVRSPGGRHVLAEHRARHLSQDLHRQDQGHQGHEHEHALHGILRGWQTGTDVPRAVSHEYIRTVVNEAIAYPRLGSSRQIRVGFL